MVGSPPCRKAVMSALQGAEAVLCKGQVPCAGLPSPVLRGIQPPLHLLTDPLFLLGAQVMACGRQRSSPRAASSPASHLLSGRPDVPACALFCCLCSTCPDMGTVVGSVQPCPHESPAFVQRIKERGPREQKVSRGHKVEARKSDPHSCL